MSIKINLDKKGGADKTKAKSESTADEFELLFCPDGRPFYYNKHTKKYFWKKPAVLMSPLEAYINKNSDWRIYSTADSRTYYMNVVTRKVFWRMPDEVYGLTLIDFNTVDSKKSSSSTNNNSGHSPLYNDFDQAARAFYQLLVDYNITSGSTYDAAIKLISDDVRFSSLKSNQDKKTVFSDYKNFKVNEERERERRLNKEIEDRLIDFLTNPNNKAVKSYMKYEKACKIFSEQTSWARINDKQRRPLFEHAMHLLEQRKRSSERDNRAQNKAAMTKILNDHANKIFSDEIFLANTNIWKNKVEPLLTELSTSEKNDENHRTILLATSLEHKYDALNAYEQWISQMNQSEQDQFQLTIDDKKHQQSVNRHAFWSLLKSLTLNNAITRKSKWKQTFKKHIKNTPEFKNLVAQNHSGSNPLDLFKIFVFKLKTVHNRETKKLILAKPQNIQFLDDIFNYLEKNPQHDHNSLYKMFGASKNVALKDAKYLVKRAARRLDKNKKKI